MFYAYFCEIDQRSYTRPIMNGAAKCRKDGGKETFPHQFSLSLLALSSYARHE